MTVAPTDAEAVRELKLPADVRGVIVTDIADSSPAAGRLATPQLGGPDVILSVEGTPVTSPESLRAALRAAKPGDIVTLRVYNVPGEESAHRARSTRGQGVSERAHRRVRSSSRNESGSRPQARPASSCARRRRRSLDSLRSLGMTGLAALARDDSAAP